MKKISVSPTRSAVIAAGLSHGRTLGSLLRSGGNAKCQRMLGEIKENVISRDADALITSLATCADASLGDDQARSSAIRAAANGFRDSVMRHPPNNRRGWSEVRDAIEKDECSPISASVATGSIAPKDAGATCVLGPSECGITATAPSANVMRGTVDDAGDRICPDFNDEDEDCSY